MNRDAWIIGIAIVAGFAAGAVGSWVGGSAAPPPPPERHAASPAGSNPLAARPSDRTGEAGRASAPATLEQLAARQAELEAELSQVSSAVDDLTSNLASRVQSSMRAQAQSRAGEFRNNLIGRAGERQQERLVEAGFTAQQASTFIARQEDAAMQRLYLRDQASREGWLGTTRYQDELAKLPDANESIRTELSDGDYDKYLYATRQRNRVMVTNVLQGSPAQSAGVQPGDIVYSMDGQRVFETHDLLTISSQGSAGEAVSVEVLRNGDMVELYVPRGPLGVNSMPQVVDPVTNTPQFGRFGFGARAMRGTF